MKHKRLVLLWVLALGVFSVGLSSLQESGHEVLVAQTPTSRRVSSQKSSQAVLSDNVRRELDDTKASLDSLRSRVDAVADSAKRIEQSQQELRVAIGKVKGNEPENWISLIATVLIPLIAMGVALYSLRSNNRMVAAGMRDRLREEERKSIREKIDQFYGPFFLLRRQSETLYRTLFIPRRSDEERRRFSDTNGNFRTIVALAAGHKFQGLDKALIDQFVSLGEQSSALAHAKMGLVDDNDLQHVLAKWTAHVFVLKLLAEGTLPGGGTEFEQLVFPSDLDEKVGKKLDELTRRLSELQTDPVSM
jgi:hypothetical protein